MDSGSNHVVRNVDNAGGDAASTGNGSLTGSVAEGVAFTTAAAAGGAIRAGWSELHAFPNKVSDLGATDLGTSSATLRWTTPGYDGANGTLQVGSTYYVRIASYTAPDTFSDFRLANISFSTSGVIPGELVSIGVSGLLGGTTYYARLWTTDGDSNVSYESNLSSFVLNGAAPPSGGEITAAFVSSVTATWAVSPGAVQYILAASTMPSLVPVAASSMTTASTASVTSLEPNTTYFLAVTACPSCVTYTAIGSTMTMAAPAINLSTTAVSSSTIVLAWNANGNPANTRFVVRSSTDNLTFVSAATVTVTTASLHNLDNDATYYLEIVALNHVGVESSPSNRLTVITPVGPVPYAPSGFTATAELLGVSVSWDALPPEGEGVGLLFYRISRSTNAGFGFVSVTTTTATSYVDKPLALGPTYYYKISARDLGQVEGPFTATLGALPFTIVPMEPLGVKITAGTTTVTLSWSTVTRHGDGHLFISTSAPLADEFIGYSITRSSEPCAPSFVEVSTPPHNATSIVNYTGGLNYFYRVRSYNSLGLSTNTVTLSTLGERSYFLEDCVSRVVLDDATAARLDADVNGLGDIRIDRRRIAADVQDSVFQSVVFTPMLNGVTPLKNYTLPVPVRIVLRFETQNGNAISPSASPAGNVAVKNLGMFWYNGAEFKKMYGTVDPLAQTVTVQSPNLGKYQIQALARADGTVFDVSNISARVFTPNGDGINDLIIFTYDPGPRNETVTGRIYDVMGSHVADMTGGQVPNTLVWNGRAGGRYVGSGLYIYRVEGGGKSYTGSVVVAR